MDVEGVDVCRRPGAVVQRVLLDHQLAVKHEAMGEVVEEVEHHQHR